MTYLATFIIGAVVGAMILLWLLAMSYPGCDGDAMDKDQTNQKETDQ